MNLWGKILSSLGWSVECRLSLPDKCVICVAPHTSNFDFPLGLAAYKSLGRKANFLMKKFWFFFPLKYLLFHLGGIPVDRSRKSGRGSLIDAVVEMFGRRRYMNLAVTPEGTRSANPNWKTGFLTIARRAGVPIVLAGIDYKHKKIVLDAMFEPGPDPDADLRAVKQYYSDKKAWARYPSKFQLDEPDE